MRLIDSLRTHLLSEVEHLHINPDRLIISVEKGTLTWVGNSPSHVQRYTAVVEIDEYPESLDPNLIIIPLINWYNEHQDDFDYKDSPIRFESYVLSNASTTVVFLLKLSESVTATIGDKGFLINHCEMTHEKNIT